MVLTVRHKDIFPPGFDHKSSISKYFASSSHYAYKSQQLYGSLVDQCNPTSLADTIIVTSAWYGKRTKSTIAHEFIVVEVKDTSHERYINYMVLDRNANNTPPGTTKSISRSQSCSMAYRAEDQFRVAYDGNLSRLLADCQFKHRQVLERLDFSPSTPFYLYELVTLAHTISELFPSYTILDSNCYIYAGLIWDCMLQAYPNATYKTDMSLNRGRFAWIRVTPDDNTKKRAYEEFQNKLLGARARIEDAQWSREQLEAMRSRRKDEEELGPL